MKQIWAITINQLSNIGPRPRVLVTLMAGLWACHPTPSSKVSVIGRTSSTMPTVCGTDKALPLTRVLKDQSRHLCSGTFVAPYLLVTAAHCLLDLERVEIKANWWTSTLSSKKWTLPPGFDERVIRSNTSSRLDIGVIDFSDSGASQGKDASAKVPFSKKMATVSYQEVKPNQAVAFAGYGPSTLADWELVKAGKWTPDRGRFSHGVNYVRKIGLNDDATVIVTRGAEDGGFAVNGDSGGPLFAYDDSGACHMVGVVSRGDHTMGLFTSFSDPVVKMWLADEIKRAYQRHAQVKPPCETK